MSDPGLLDDIEVAEALRDLVAAVPEGTIGYRPGEWHVHGESVTPDGSWTVDACGRGATLVDAVREALAKEATP